MKYFAVIDTNVIVSAFIKNGSIPDQVIRYVYNGTITPILNESILSEYRDVLSRPKLNFPENITNRLLGVMENKGIFIDPIQTNEFFPDPKDRVFYEIVMKKWQTDDAYLITGNLRHFPVKPFVVTPREMLEIVRGIKTEQYD